MSVPERSRVEEVWFLRIPKNAVNGVYVFVVAASGAVVVRGFPFEAPFVVFGSVMFAACAAFLIMPMMLLFGRTFIELELRGNSVVVSSHDTLGSLVFRNPKQTLSAADFPLRLSRGERLFRADGRDVYAGRQLATKLATLREAARLLGLSADDAVRDACVELREVPRGF